MFWPALRGNSGQTITHVWTLGGAQTHVVLQELYATTQAKESSYFEVIQVLIFFTFVSFPWCIEILLFSSTSCITGVVSYVFLEIFGREIGARPAKIHITYACPTFHRCDSAIKGEPLYTFLSYFKRKGQNYLSCFWGRVRSCARAFRLCWIKARLFLISSGDTSLTNEWIPKLKFE